MTKKLKGGTSGGRLKQSNVRKMERGGMQRLPRRAQHSRAGVNPYGSQCTYAEETFVSSFWDPSIPSCTDDYACHQSCISHCGGAACVNPADNTTPPGLSNCDNMGTCTCFCLPG